MDVYRSNRSNRVGSLQTKKNRTGQDRELVMGNPPGNGEINWTQGNRLVVVDLFLTLGGLFFSAFLSHAEGRGKKARPPPSVP
jgi:hypothetical protein